MNPLKYLFEKPILSGRIARWTMMLAEFDLTFMALKSIKGKVISNYLADFPVSEDKQEAYDFPDEEIFVTDDDYWQLFFDGASNQKGYGIGVLLTSPDGAHTPLSVKLDFSVTNNEAEYEACILGLRAAAALGLKNLRVYRDSSLIINQILGKWKVKSEGLALYQMYLETILKHFDDPKFIYLSRDENQFADALAKVAAMINIPHELENIPLCIERREEPAYCMALDNTVAGDDAPWFTDVLNYHLGRGFPPDSDVRTQRAIKRFAAQFILSQGKLYKKSKEGVLLLCVGEKEAQRIMEEVHNGTCGPHMNGRMLAIKIMRIGYFWSTQEHDCTQYVKRCHKCQIYANAQHIPPLLLYNFASPWPFSIWGIDIIGKITPKGTGGHEFILVAIDYFTKWVEAAFYATLTSKHVAKFITENIICRYGVPRELISDHGSHFKKDVAALLTHYKIQQRKSSTFRPQMNGAVEAVNKNVKTIIEKMTEKYHDWPAKLPFALWGYRTSVRTPTGATPYSLVYGMEAVLPIELEIPSLRIALESRIPEVDWVQARYEELLLIDEKRLTALNQVQLY
ncbi:uncharacterized protein LOC141632673 [Silene latifolia]|uniref:uncharacterized protein LOC141632673 n=1 Tax=Silene latifolia TaxID=37657 RepID=UPI003D7745A4